MNQSYRNRNLLINLRHRYPVLAEKYSDAQLVKLYDLFVISDEYGNNDELFPLWLSNPPADYE